MPNRKLIEYLEDHGIKYVVMSHSTAYTALEVAEAVHISGREIAKSVMVKADGTMVMIVLPASMMIDLARLKTSIGATQIELANEDDFMRLFPDCEIGAMPPFGNLYGMKVYIDPALTEDQDIAFNAGNHREIIRMFYDDFDQLVRPRHLRTSCALAMG